MIRNTKQRKAIMAAIDEADRPLSPAEIHELGRRNCENLGLRTVYRNIREMVDEQKLVPIDYPGQPLRYERVRDKKHRPHFICRGCNRVFELEMEIPNLTASLPSDFLVDGHETIFYGYCPGCREGEDCSR